MKKGFKGLIWSVFLVLAACSAQDKYQQSMTGAIPASIIPYYEREVGAPQYEDLFASSKSSQSVRVGMLLPLTGPSAKLGEDLRNAGMLAQFDIANDNFVLQFYDTKGTANGAKEAFDKAVAENVQIILGPVFSQEVGAVKKAARRKNIPVVSFTSDTDQLGSGVYTMALLLSQQTERIIRYACEQKKTRLAILAPDNKAGDIAIDTANKTAKKCGMEVTRLAVYNPTFINFEPYVLSVLPESFATKKKYAHEKKKEKEQETEPELPVAQQLDFDALFIADDGNRLKSIASLFGLYDVTPKDVLFLGMSTWNDNSLTNEGALLGGKFPVLPDKGFEAFAQKYRGTYQKEPIRLASLAYDAVALTSVLSQNNGLTEEALTTVNGFLGTDGLFRLKPDGKSERLMGISQIVSRNVIEPVERPAASFVEEEYHIQHLSDMKILNEYRASQRVATEKATLSGGGSYEAATSDFADEADLIDVTPAGQSAD